MNREKGQREGGGERKESYVCLPGVSRICNLGQASCWRFPALPMLTSITMCCSTQHSEQGVRSILRRLHLSSGSLSILASIVKCCIQYAAAPHRTAPHRTNHLPSFLQDLWIKLVGSGEGGGEGRGEERPTSPMTKGAPSWIR